MKQKITHTPLEIDYTKAKLYQNKINELVNVPAYIEVNKPMREEMEMAESEDIDNEPNGKQLYLRMTNSELFSLNF